MGKKEIDLIHGFFYARKRGRVTKETLLEKTRLLFYKLILIGHLLILNIHGESKIRGEYADFCKNPV